MLVLRKLSFFKKEKTNKFIHGPISKQNFLGKKHLGITEFIAHKTGNYNKAVMLIYSRKLAVVPITTHIPIKKVSSNKFPMNPLFPLTVNQYVSVWNVVKNNAPVIEYKIIKNKLSMICKIFLFIITDNDIKKNEIGINIEINPIDFGCGVFRDFAKFSCYG